MSSKIFINNYAALIESEILNKEVSISLLESDIVVNPSNKNLFNKIIVIDLPINLPLEQLIKKNKIISRFPISSDYIELIPFELPKNREKVEDKDYSLLILSKDLINNPKYSKLINDNNFLIGINECIDGYSTLTGYLISRTKIEEI